jgi:hypothetical protein
MYPADFLLRSKSNPPSFHQIYRRFGRLANNELRGQREGTYGQAGRWRLGTAYKNLHTEHKPDPDPYLLLSFNIQKLHALLLIQAP